MASVWDGLYSTIGDIVNQNTQGTQPTQPQPQQGAGRNTNLWLAPGMDYGQTQDWYNTPISAAIREQNPRLAFNAWGGRQGIPENDSTFSRWFNETQFPRFQSAMGQATLYNPMLTIDQFLSTLPSYQQLQSQFGSLSPTARGANYREYSPVSRWINR